MAEALYSAIMTDTGSFRFNNTNVRTHQIAAELLDLGVRAEAMYSNIYESTYPARLRLLGLSLSRLNVTPDGRIGWMAVTQDMLREAGAKPQDTEDFVNFPAYAERDPGQRFVHRAGHRHHPHQLTVQRTGKGQ